MIAKGRERYPTGAEHWSRHRPERIPRGDNHYMRKHPEKRTRGDKHWNTKLTDQDVRDIRARVAAGGVTQRVLAAEYGVTFQHISAVVKRKFRSDVV